MKKVSTISVVTVCLNCRDTIALTLESVKQQTFDRIEHIIIDGGSDDGTAEIVEAHGVDYFLSEPDEGIYHAMEKGVAAATGDALIFLNSGDLFYDPTVSTDVVQFFNQTRSDIVFGDFFPYTVNPDDDYDHSCFTPGQVCKLKAVTNRRMLANRNIHHQALFYSKKIFEKCSYFSDEWPEGSDYILNVQALVQHGYRAKYFDRIVTKFALGGVSTSNFTVEKKQCGDLSAIIRGKYFQKPIECDPHEYIHAPGSSFQSRIRRFLKGTPPWRAARWLLNRLAERFVHELDAKLGFQVRIDSIYQRIENLTAAVGKQMENSADLRQILQQRTDSIYQQVSEQRKYAESLHHKVDLQREMLISNNAVTRKFNADICNLQINISHLLNEKHKDQDEISQAGYRIKSQFDEDGIIQYLVDRIRMPNRIFVEFGVENYVEANTRLLLEKDNWSGLVIDSSSDYIDQVKQSDLCWKHGLKAVDSFITCENINELIAGAGIAGDIGLLSIDIDGVDYWVWNAIEVISPRIVVCEYNSIFGSAAKVSVPYDPQFDRIKKHFSGLYAGASLGALSELAKHKGYALVGGNAAGNNAFFVREDCIDRLQTKSVASVYVKAQFRESRDPDGNLSYLPIEEGVKLLKDLPVFDLETQCERPIGEIKIVYAT